MKKGGNGLEAPFTYFLLFFRFKGPFCISSFLDRFPGVSCRV